MQCPKCRGMMQTYNRSGVHIEQCGHCRGIFLDYGELENLTRLEAGYAAPPPPPPAAPAPAWGAPAPHYRHGHHYQHRGFGKMLFSS
ncbi:zf-TFIIB domain-containing protein [Nocardia cyriacigeorgica]|uniref:Transcription factor zinc-finger domain-containing protein n=2 Tax=Nocardia cyriacigeorgica TaxID=135487 RepID=A0A5R8P5C7_9NOCA|nr:zf-TFIIB domain-containing protein [Nocardia cyriacigeorgica]MBF6084129.1 zf-TFIIB domain-containing protein [Nocardia cyriacigeorgica]MBF6088766.1 zf-TFIIB domain-containing protein [Nocardia cyriacigeorgica]MBF6100344.1 zf-TFIIB domain-containing protein [Nocardia cyriacigeorgica]MBF6157509.1 zf-TFIIB domain-containing protein [Nocardia cyriacigeorgica]MBF6196480.1 zf-TFIIB domain-containing protein [Nocardia cyriacigeorgica]